MWARHPYARCNAWKKQHCCNVSVTNNGVVKNGLPRLCAQSMCCFCKVWDGYHTIRFFTWRKLRVLVVAIVTDIAIVTAIIMVGTFIFRSFSCLLRISYCSPLFFQRLIFVVPRAGRASSSRTYFRRHTAIRGFRNCVRSIWVVVK